MRYRVMARNGDPVPEIAGATYSSFTAPVLNRNAEIFFGAKIAGGGATASNDFVLVAGRTGAWTRVARESDAVAGLSPGVHLAPGLVPFENLRFNDAGHLAFVARLAGAGVTASNDTCYVWGRPGDVRVIAREGDPVPGATEGETFDDLAQLDGLNLLLGAADDVAFVAQWRGPTAVGINAGLWLGPATNLTLVLRDGRPAPDFPGATMKNLQFATARLNPAGLIAIAGQTTAFPLDTAVWAGRTNGLRAIWREGDVVPGTNLVFRGFSAVTVNVNTQYCLAAALDAASSNDSAILAGSATNLQVVAREGSHAPGLPADVVFKDLALVEPLFGARGDVAFTATIDGPGIGTTNGTAIWAGLPGALRVVSRRGDSVPDEPTGVVYSTSFAATFSLAGLNDNGALAFMTQVEGPGIGLANDQGLWGGTPGFETLLLQREDAIDLGDAQLHQVHMMDMVDIGGQLQNGGGQDGRARGLNDVDQEALALTFKAGQGSAIVLVESIRDVELNGLVKVLERAHGIPSGGSVEGAKLWIGQPAAAPVLRFQEATTNATVSLELRVADSPAGPWQNAELSVTNAADQGGVDAGAIRRETRLPPDPAGRFYRLEAVIQPPPP